MTVLPRAAFFHGVNVVRRYAPFPGDAYQELLSPFSASTEQPVSTITIDAEQIADPVPETMLNGLAPWFFVGLVQVYDPGSGYVLSDGASHIRVDCGERTMTMIISDTSKRRRPGIVATMQHLALDLLLREVGLFCVHAGAACTPDRALVVVGGCGAGKTTTILALMTAGCRYLGDDRLLLDERGGALGLASYPREFHVDPTTTTAFGLGRWVEPAAAAAAAGKQDIAPSRAFRGQHLESWTGPITVLFPRVVDQSTSVMRPITRAEAFGMILASSAMTLVEGVHHAGQNLRLLKRLANEASVFDVALGRDMISNPALAARSLLNAVS